MRIDFQPPGAWSSLNDTVAEALKVDLDKNAVRTYQGVGHGLIEVTQGLARLFPLKKKIYYFKNMNPLFESALMLLAREGYQLTALDEKTLAAPAEWAATLAREDLFVLYSVDEPFLGRAYDVEAFEKAVSDKGLFKIRVSHMRHLYALDNWRQASPIDKNTVLIYALQSTWAVAVLGERARLGPLVADQLRVLPPMGSLEWYRNPKSLDETKVKNFESKNIAGSTPVLPADKPRVFDRAVISWRDMDGHAVIDRLAQALGFELKPPGSETRLETTSLSRWGGVRTMDFYKNQGLTPETLRGLVLIHHDLLDGGGELEKTLLKVRKSILEDQFGPEANL